MLLKKQKSVIAVILSAALAVSSAVPSMTVSAVGTRVKQEKYGDDSYAKRFLSLYDDVITNGQENGYLSKNNVASGGFGVPYYSVEELCIESVDYGHETTSDTLSYMVWMAAMRDAISQSGSITNPDGSTTAVDKTSDLAKAWNTMEMMIPSVQTGLMSKNDLNVTYSPEWEEPEMYYGDNIAMVLGNTGKNPIHTYFKNAYSGDSGLYLMHWLADVDDWYGFGGGNGKFTFINTFQRGVQESCWETVPHPSVEEKKYGNSKNGIKGIFMSTTDSVAAQWDYCNDPAAEERAIQAIYYANRFGAGDSSIIVKAGKMGDQLRNNMFDKYYKKIGSNDVWSIANDMSSAHYLMSWYTLWGGAMDGTWAWQTGSSQCHEISQNPLAAFALLQDEGLRNSMKATGAVNDYKTSLQRQLEFYLWLQSADGPIAGGATSSWNGRYETPKYDSSDAAKYGTTIPATFYGMSYQEHPAQLDPGSNHWIGNQVLAMQRLAEMYYVIKTEGDTTGVTIDSVNGAMTLEETLKAILDKWVEWFVGKVYLYDDGTYSIPVALDWFGQPADWNGTYNPDANKNLTCTVTSVGSSDLGCVSSLANTLIYYAKANNINYKAAYSMNNTDAAAKGLYIANELLKREWKLGRDDIGLSLTETNGSMYRLFEQDVFIPEYYSGTMPNGDSLENGATFLSFRSQYLQNEKVQEFKAAYDNAKSTGGDITDAMESVELNYHRFWHAGDIMAAMAAMYNLYPEVDPNKDDSDVNDFVWGEDNWNFLNSGSYFKHSTYYLSDNYLDKLRENLSNTEWYYAMQWKNDYWGGSCYGMSSLALLSKEGLFPYSKYTKGADCLYDIQTPAQNSDVESLINYYQLLQVKDDIQQQYRSVPYKTNEENIKNIISQLNNSSEVLVGFKKSGWGGHAVIAYDVSYGSWTVNGVTYQGRIEILDPNYSMNYNSNACIYFNTSSYNWTIPAYSVYNVKSTSGAAFNMVLSDTDIINNGGYLSDSADTVINNFIASLEIAASSDTYDINKIVKNSDGKFSNQAAAPDEILPASFYFAGGETEGTNGYVLKDSNSGYKIQQNNAQKMDMSINYENCLIEADAEAGTAVIFDPSGFAEINGEATNYSFNMVYDEGYYPTDWYTINVSGNNADNMSIQKADNGYIMEGNNFSNVIISANNDKNSAVFKFSTNYPKVFICETDENTIGVSVDKDNNGTYETKLNNTISESLGDVNTDGSVTVSDIVLMQKYFTKTEKFNAVQYAVADVNIDGIVNVFDVIELKRVVMNI